ncbi:GNAT family N-acetyltransferase [Alkaliphilus peptidifermentans]|uniref:Acetyltransferase (GNAT) domain-containing protein n=1 Tax=Alkaliphilus peptidifermentans DSM 18978 TaxID=1120976 RepID=A0A1G5G3X4_9FIRM|nr:GNAT family protein [Alkaliphilus peptidifermentans]SCY45940.1 Acetyltransferase (GNAT) domain-containing protein [Alkaliphilus peptidifermentans DSM 18978]
MKTKTILETERLIMREFDESDLCEYIELISDENVYKWLGNRKQKTSEEARNTINYFIKEFSKNGIGVFAVISKESKKLIGQVGVKYINELDATEYLYALDYREWNKGYATEIGKNFIQYYRTKFPNKKLVAIVYPDNIQSKKVLSKLNFEFKGQKEIFETKLDYYEI